jgi:hypothetical protein
MANNIGWGSIYAVTNWGKGVVNSISWGKVYSNLVGSLPSFALNFNTIADDFTFTRASSATYVDSGGVIQTVSSNVPRIDYSTGEGAFLLEPASTNLVTYSEDFTDSSWLKDINIVLTPNQTSPDGGNNAYKVEGTIGSSYLIDGGFGAITPQSRSIYMKADINGVVYSLGDNQSNQINVTTEWQRFELQEVSSSVYAVDFRGSGVTLDTVYIWGAQLEALDYATSYIPTSGTTATRAAETCVDATPTINSEEGVLYAEISALYDDGTYRVIEINDKTALNRVLFYYRDNDRIIFNIKIANVNVLAQNITSANVTDTHKLALAWSQDNFSAWVDGVKVETITSGNTFAPNTLIDLDFSDPFGNIPFHGNTKDLRVYTEALTDEELTELTTI